MKKLITWVALDTSKKKHVAAILYPGLKEPKMATVANEARAIRRFGRKLVREAPGEVRVCYEAGPCGYVLKRQLETVSPRLTCEVIAPSLIPVRPGQRIKTDPRDARKLVHLYRSGELTVVHPPTEAEEAVRDLMRCREDAKEDLTRCRHRCSKFLLRRGRVYGRGQAWTLKHKHWLSEQSFDHEADREVLEDYLLAISQLESRTEGLDSQIEQLSQKDPYREPVGWLRCFKGIDTITAMTILAEIHDFVRFSKARELMSYLGLVPSEYTTADRVRRGSLTKTGNSHVRRVLVESAWCNRHRPAVGARLKKRREGQPAWVIAHADRAMGRLHRRYHRLLSKGKPHNKVVAAVARELVGFVWAVMQEGLRRQEPSAPGKLRLQKVSSRKAA